MWTHLESGAGWYSIEPGAVHLGIVPYTLPCGQPRPRSRPDIGEDKHGRITTIQSSRTARPDGSPLWGPQPSICFPAFQPLCLIKSMSLFPIFFPILRITP